MNKTALLLGGVGTDSIQTSLTLYSYKFQSKILNSSIKNWESICYILENSNLIVLCKLTEYTIFKMCTPEYESIANRFLEILKSRKHQIYVYKNNLRGDFSYFKKNEFEDFSSEDVDLESYSYPSAVSPEKRLTHWIEEQCIEMSQEEYLNKVRLFIKGMNENLNILPYEKTLDISIAGQNFIECLTEGLIFKIFIPNERIWSSEFDKFITLFGDYASTIANVELKIVQRRTETGVLCSLYSKEESLNDITIDALFKNFSSFMDLCASSPEAARDIIDKIGLNQEEKARILQKYIKESQRLLLDIKQEREMKMLAIKHRLENEIQEYDLYFKLDEHIMSVVPQSSISSLLSVPSCSYTQIININPQIINKVEGIVCNEMNGTANFTAEDKELIDVIQKYTQNITEFINLQTSLYEINNKSSSKESKRTAWQKLYGFLMRVTDKVGDVGVALLAKYLEQKMNL